MPGAGEDGLLVDRDHQLIEAHAGAVPGASLGTLQSLEQRLSAASAGWNVPRRTVPGLQEKPESGKPPLSRRRAEAFAEILKAQGIDAVPAAALPIRLSIG